MYRMRLREPRFQHGLRIEQLETRTLFHLGTFAFVNGVLDIVPDHGDNTILVQWDPDSRSLGVVVNGQEQLRVAASEVRSITMSGLQGNDVVFMDARLDLLVTYDRGGDKGVLRSRLNGSGDGSDYYVATPGSEEFVLTRRTGQGANPTRGTSGPAGTDTDASRALAGIHAGHSMMGSAGGADMYGGGAVALRGDMGTAFMNHRLYAAESPYLHGGGAGLDNMVTMDYLVTMGAKPKWMPPG